MGLPGFIEESWAQADFPTLRVILTPSFHPEVCITLSRRLEGTSLSVIALIERVWVRGFGVYLPREEENVHLASSVFDEASDLFNAAHAAFDPKRLFICVDGMGSESCLVSGANTRRMRAHVWAQASIGQLVARLIEVSWNGCRRPVVRNALAHAALYLDGDYPLQEVPPKPETTHLAILGSEEERDEFLQMVRKAKKRKT